MRVMWYENARLHAGPELGMLLDPADEPTTSKAAVGAERAESHVSRVRPPTLRNLLHK